ncbi:site-specific integrase [Salinivibrio sp. YCSC6]|uniref:tyrosine-type recombinase/integrase n=1 Tax=Salinivibrio sp. YCSC6 TaxID=2003370 RepID=UPI000BBC16C8|nr:site-specific integrase [Salinivibrio sp. YCSC6]PCE67995.1 hypothetical protein B6G00_06640 [Salinivibrio sp. YCSC6]QCF35110.1 site-specific integrase [Salinivibrio sp. YCSC6]
MMRNPIHTNVNRVLSYYGMNLKKGRSNYYLSYYSQGETSVIKNNNPRDAIREAINRQGDRELYIQLINQLRFLKLNPKKQLYFSEIFILDPRYTTRPSPPLGTLKDAYDFACEMRWNSRNIKDHKATKRKAENVIKHFGYSTPPSDITPRRLVDYVGYLQAKNLSNATINRNLSKLRVVLRHAVMLDYIPHVPDFPWQKYSNARTRILSKEEEEKVISFFHKKGNTLMADFVMVAIDTGARVGELMRLTWSDYRLDSESIFIRNSKNDEFRTVPLTKRSRHVFKRRYQNMCSPEENIFNLTQDRLSWQWKVMKKSLGFDKEKEFVPHMMRHTCATRLAELDVNDSKRMLWIGHKTPVMTARYTHMTSTSLKSVVEIIDSQA